MKPRKNRRGSSDAEGPDSPRKPVRPVGLRIISGKLRRRKLAYSGSPDVRPMKDRVREAVFNLLGYTVEGAHALDLFAGTGALGLECISRGAVRATMIEQDTRTAELIRRNVAALEVEPVCSVITADVFRWAERWLPQGPEPWIVFASPPYAFYVDRLADMLTLIGRILEAAPPKSGFVVESDDRFDFGLLPNPAAWDLRSYPPAQVGIYFKELEEPADGRSES